MSAISSSAQDKQSPYVGYFRSNGSRTASRLFEPNSNPNVGVYRHSPASTTSKGLQEILRDKRTSLKPKSVISTLQLFNLRSLPKHLEKKTLEMMPTSHFISHREQGGDEVEETPMCPICLEHFIDGDEIRNLNCDHCFHKSCIDVWLLGTMSSDVTTTVCPTCRQDASSVITEPETGSSVYSAPDNPAPISTIPAECFLRVGQFLLSEGSKSKDTSSHSQQIPSEHIHSSPKHRNSPTVSPPLPLPPIAASRSPPLPPLLSLPPPLLTTPSPTSGAAFIINSDSPSPRTTNTNTNTRRSTLHNSPSDSSIASTSSQYSSSGQPPSSRMFFPPLDDSSSNSTPSQSPCTFMEDDNEINYHILANNGSESESDEDKADVSGSFMNIGISDIENIQGRQ